MACVILRARDFKCRASLTLCVGAACPGVELEIPMPQRVDAITQIFTMTNMMYAMAVLNMGAAYSVWLVRPRRVNGTRSSLKGEM